ncbi:hypothetical protein C8J56DRAFT_244849 [Mycena floridula]|nr:hypothetical protein C8J56DRAFT_244849 [Mycena floridula]
MALKDEGASPGSGRLPTEILRKVFRLCLNGVDFTGEMLGEHDSPFTMSHVCRRWHEIATSYPALWSNIFLSRQAVSKDTNAAKLFHQVILYSASSLLDITIDRKALEHATQLSRGFCLSTSRWKKVQLHMDDMVALVPFRHGFDALHEVFLMGRPTRYDEPDALRVFEMAPSLRTVFLENIPKVIGRLHLPWSAIIQYDSFCDSGRTQVLGLLQRCCAVQSASFRADGYQVMKDKGTAIVFPVLQTLSLSFECTLATILDLMTLPALTSLSLATPRWCSADFTSLATLGTRSHFALTHLELTDANKSLPESITFPEFLAFLSNTPTLTHLILKNCGMQFGIDVTEHLNSTTMVVLPKLTHLTIQVKDHNWPDGNTAVNVILESIECRSGGSSTKLEEVKITNVFRTPDLASLDRVAALQDSGLMFTVFEPRSRWF